MHLFFWENWSRDQFARPIWTNYFAGPISGLGELVYPNFCINFGTNSEKGRNWSGLCWDQLTVWEYWSAQFFKTNFEIGLTSDQFRVVGENCSHDQFSGPKCLPLKNTSKGRPSALYFYRVVLVFVFWKALALWIFTKRSLHYGWQDSQ